MPSASPPTEPLVLTQRVVRVVAALILLGGVVWVGALALDPEPPPVERQLRALANASDLDATSVRNYTDLFDASYRPDAGIGNAALAAVYYTPRLHAALQALTQRSEHQEELLDLLGQEGANETTLAFYLIVDRVTSQARLDLAQDVELVDDAGRRYPFRDLRRVYARLPQQAGQVRTASVLFFSSTADDGVSFSRQHVEQLQLTVRGVGEVPERVFRWDLRLLP